MCSLHALSLSISDAENRKTYVMRMSAQIEVDDLRPFVQNSEYSKASYVSFFFKHPDIEIDRIEIGRLGIDKLVRSERIAIEDSIRVPCLPDLFVAYDFRDVKDKQVGKLHWVCSTSEYPKGSVTRAVRNDNYSTVSIISAVRLKVVVGIDDPDASPVRFGIIGTKYGASLPYYEFVNPSLASPGTLLNDHALMRQVKMQLLSELIKDEYADWIMVKNEVVEIPSDSDDDHDDWLLLDSIASATEVSVTSSRKSNVVSATNIYSNGNSFSAGRNMYVCLNSAALQDNGAIIIKEYLKLAHQKYRRIPTKAETRQLMALMQHYGLATSLTAYKLANEVMVCNSQK